MNAPRSRSWLLRAAFSATLPLALLAACRLAPAEAPAPAPPAPSASGPAALLAPITTLIGEAQCDGTGQCHVVGIGAKPCGGPSSYLAWSGKKTDPAALRAAVEAQARAEKEDQQRHGLVSNCMVSPEPAAVCRPRASDGQKTCQLGQGGVRSAI